MRASFLALFGLLLIPAAAPAAVHTLDFSGNACHSTSDPGPCFSASSNTPISSHYGDDATVDVSYRSLSLTTGATTIPFLVWKGSAGDLANVAYGVGYDTDLAEIGFAPSAGYEVSLTSFDIACANPTSCGPFAYSVLTGDGELITSDAAIINNGSIHFSFAPDTDYFGEPIVLRWTNSQHLGIDNIVFQVRQVTTPVPEPASWAMMLGGFGLIGGALRRRPSLPAPSAAASRKS